MTKHVKVLLTFGLTILTFNQLIAQHSSETSHSQESSHKHHTHKHHLALFNGITTNFKHDVTAYAVGFDYEYRFGELMGLTLLAEYITFDPEEIVTGAGLVFHPYEGLKFIAAPIVLFTEEHDKEQHTTTTVNEGKEATFAFRIGAAYDFHFGNFSVGPVVNYDAGKAKDLSYGLVVGIGF